MFLLINKFNCIIFKKNIDKIKIYNKLLINGAEKHEKEVTV